jgi:hypothetical protein
MAYATKDALCNAALNFLGEPDATPFTGGTTVRDVACSRHYDQALQHVLMLHRWDFATDLHTLAAVSSQPSNKPADFPVAYTLPSDYLRLQEIILSTGFRKNTFRLLGSYLWLETTGIVGKIVYTKNDVATTAMPSTFADCVMMELCKRMAPMLTQDAQKMEQMHAQHRETFAHATAAETRMSRSNENTSPLDLAYQSEVFLSRFRR